MTTQYYKGWRIRYAGEHPVTGRWRAEKFGVGMGHSDRDALLRMIDAKEQERDMQRERLGVKTDREVIQTRDHVEMIKRPYLWPYPVLCLKRRENKTAFPNEFGRLESSGNGYRVFVVENIVEVVGTIEYASAEAVIADGWEVD